MILALAFGYLYFGILLVKAIRAKIANESYAFTQFDGGLLFRGREANAGVMIGVWGFALLGLAATTVWFVQSLSHLHRW